VLTVLGLLNIIVNKTQAKGIEKYGNLERSTGTE